MNFNFLRNKSFGIDLGNNNTIVSDANCILLSQPSYIVFDKIRGSVKAIGDEAFRMFEKSHNELKAVKPLKGGVIADYDSASAMINEMVRKTKMKRTFYEGFDTVISGIPYMTTEVERRALLSALEQFNAHRTYLVFEPLAGALGMDLNIREPNGKMVVDIGGGITEIVIISLSGIASFQAVKVSGDSMDVDIKDYFRRQYNMAIGLKTAEQVKILAGAVYEKIQDAPAPLPVKGKDMLTGLPVTRVIDHQEVCMVLEKSMVAIEAAIVQTLEKCPPELASDIYLNGIHITGGNALLRGLKQRLERNIKLPIHIDENALVSVSRGIGQILRDPNHYKSILIQ